MTSPKVINTKLEGKFITISFTAGDGSIQVSFFIISLKGMVKSSQCDNFADDRTVKREYELIVADPLAYPPVYKRKWGDSEVFIQEFTNVAESSVYRVKVTAMYGMGSKTNTFKTIEIPPAGKIHRR